jgi:hypothetical protein
MFADRARILWRSWTRRGNDPPRAVPLTRADKLGAGELGGPPEPVGGQDERPDLRLAVVATIRLLADAREIVAELDSDGARDMVLRMSAVLTVWRRILRRIDRGLEP